MRKHKVVETIDLNFVKAENSMFLLSKQIKWAEFERTKEELIQPRDDV